jgi:hypothetical protein
MKRCAARGSEGRSFVHFLDKGVMYVIPKILVLVPDFTIILNGRIVDDEPNADANMSVFHVPPKVSALDSCMSTIAFNTSTIAFNTFHNRLQYHILRPQSRHFLHAPRQQFILAIRIALTVNHVPLAGILVQMGADSV